MIFLSVDCFGQLKPDTLIDKQTFTKYILDSTGRCFTAIDNYGKQIWKFNYWKENLFLRKYDKHNDYILTVEFVSKSEGLSKSMIRFFSKKYRGLIEEDNGSIYLVTTK